MRREGARRGPDSGSVTVEATGVLALLSIMAVAAVQVAVLINAYVLAGLGVREGAREAALGGSDAEVVAMVEQVVGHSLGTVTVTPSVRNPGDLIEVAFWAPVPILPILDLLVPELTVEDAAYMRGEVVGGG